MVPFSIKNANIEEVNIKDEYKVKVAKVENAKVCDPKLVNPIAGDSKVYEEKCKKI